MTTTEAPPRVVNVSSYEDRVIVRPYDQPDRTESGIWLAGIEETPVIGVVVHAGPKARDRFPIVPGLPVVVAKYEGAGFHLRSEAGVSQLLLVVPASDVVAFLNLSGNVVMPVPGHIVVRPARVPLGDFPRTRSRNGAIVEGLVEHGGYDPRSPLSAAGVANPIHVLYRHFKAHGVELSGTRFDVVPEDAVVARLEERPA